MTTVGLTGAIELKIEGEHMQEGPKGSSKIATFGIIIENGAHPFMKTKIIKIVPRYIVFNNMNEALVIKQKNGLQQHAIMPQTKFIYNFENKEKDAFLQVRSLH